MISYNRYHTNVCYLSLLNIIYHHLGELMSKQGLHNSRRGFIKSMAFAGGAIAVNSLINTKADASFSSYDPDLHGVIESHVHAEPDVRARCIDQVTLTQQCQQVGMRAVMYKCHDFSTVDNAYLLNATIPGITVLGGLVLNKNNGNRVNAQAAELSTRVTGGYCRCIWMPTYQSDFDQKRKNAIGIPVLDNSGNVLPEVVKVMELCAEKNIIFATGHSSPAESVTLIKKARELGLPKAVVTHCTQAPWMLTLDQAKEVLEYGGYLEHSVLPYFKGENAFIESYRSARHTSMKEFAAYIALDAKQQFINTDLGQIMNPSPIEGMRTFIQGLRNEGVSQSVIDLVSKQVPAYLLGLEKRII